MGETLRLRSSQTRTMYAFALPILAVLAIIVPPTNRAPVLTVVLLDLIAVLCLLCWWRILRSGIFATTEGLQIRGFVRTTSLHWNEIDKFILRRTCNFGRAGAVRSTSGRTHGTIGYGARIGDPNANILIANLEDVRSRLDPGRQDRAT